MATYAESYRNDPDCQALDDARAVIDQEWEAQKSTPGQSWWREADSALRTRMGARYAEAERRCQAALTARGMEILESLTEDGLHIRVDPIRRER